MAAGLTWISLHLALYTLPKLPAPISPRSSSSSNLITLTMGMPPVRHAANARIQSKKKRARRCKCIGHHIQEFQLYMQASLSGI
jgi:hypothetical protein